MSNRRDPATTVFIVLFGGGLAVAVLAYVGAQLLVSAGRAAARRPHVESSDEEARRVVRGLAECLDRYRTAHPESGFPATLDELRASGSCDLTRVGRGAPAHHDLVYHAALPDAQGRRATFTLCSRPTIFGDLARETVVADDLPDHLRNFGAYGHKPQDPRAREADTCTDAWVSIYWVSAYLSAIKACALDYAAAAPGRGYPSDIADLGTRGNGCLEGIGTLSFEGDVVGWYGLHERRFAYLPSPPDADGRVTHYEIHHLEEQRAWSDETGVVHVPNDSDPGVWRERPLEYRAAIRLRRSEVASNPLWLEKECRGGSPDRCVQWGDALVSGMHPDWNAGIAAYGVGCDRGSGQACFIAAETMLRPPDSSAAAARHAAAASATDPGPAACARFQRACTLGFGEGCWEIGRRVEEQRCAPIPGTNALALTKQACAAGLAAACAAVGTQVAKANAAEPGLAEAAKLLDAACAAREFEACGPLGLMYSAGGAFPKPEWGRYYLRRGCALGHDAEACAMIRDP